MLVVDYCTVAMTFLFIWLNIWLIYKFAYWKYNNNKLSNIKTLESVIFESNEANQIVFSTQSKTDTYKVYGFDITQYLTNKNATYDGAKYVGFWISANRYLNGNKWWKYLLLLMPPIYTTLNGKRIEMTHYQNFYNKHFLNMD
ncbi:hypothetical protein ACNQ2T_00330 [Mycoplasma sp. Z407A]|uniref:hypothetical protein n=1 Tax=Mycoplasma sp. Z407A TaxID=3401678 RepID=UPI003AADE5E1